MSVPNSVHMNTYSQKGCIGCKPCEGGAANIGRIAVLCTLGVSVVGLLVLPLHKKCQYCGHNTFMNAHGAPGSHRH